MPSFLRGEARWEGVTGTPGRGSTGREMWWNDTRAARALKYEQSEKDERHGAF
jgi:hypothetical protein